MRSFTRRLVGGCELPGHRILLARKSDIIGGIVKRSLSVSGTDEADSYLFQSASSVVEFTAIEEEMAQLNDFCVAFTESVERKIDKLTAWPRDAANGKFEPREDDLFPITPEDIAFSADWQIASWRDTYEFIAPSNCLLLLSCFTEKSLRWLCDQIGDGREIKTRGARSKITAYLIFLRENCELDFEEPTESAVVREQCRELRNYFAHGEWDECRRVVGDVSLPEAFGCVSRLFEAIESAYNESP